MSYVGNSIISIFPTFYFFCYIFIDMGRKSHNKTYEQVLNENRERAKKYYNLHKEEIKLKKMEKYNKLKKSSRLGG